MKRFFVGVASPGVVAWLLIFGHSQAAPLPTSTMAPAAQTRVAEPPKAAAVQLAAAPAKKVDFPQKGKNITVIVPVPPGGPLDSTSPPDCAGHGERPRSPLPGDQQVGCRAPGGLTELAKARPDGYTIGMTALPTAITTYLDPKREAKFGRKNLQTLAMHVDDPSILAVTTSSPYQGLKDLFDAAKAKPETIKASAFGPLSHDHLVVLLSQKLSGAEFAIVHFQNTPRAIAALMGGHIDVFSGNVGAVLPQVKNGEIRVLGVAAKERSRFLPDVQTFEEQGYKFQFSSSRGWIAPAGVPREIVDVLSQSIKNAMDGAEHRRKLEAMGVVPRYLDAAQFGAFWDEKEVQVTPLLKGLK